MSRPSCSVSESPLLFLDANALASPVTRTLLITGARADSLRWTWSKPTNGAEGCRLVRRGRLKPLKTKVERRQESEGRIAGI